MNPVASSGPLQIALLGLFTSLSAAAPTPAAAGPAAPPPSEETRVAEAVERALQKHGPEVHRCFEKALADRLDAAGKMEVEVDVGPGGRVTAADVQQQGGDVPPVLSSCVQTSAQAWTIDGIEAGASLILPFAFEGQANQFVVKEDDAPDHGPAAGKGKAARRGPFTVKVLADPLNVRAPQASLTLLTIGPASRVAMHRHPRSSKILFLLKGKARVLGPPGTAPLRADAGTAIFLPPGYPHVIENMGRQVEAVFLQAFAPPGPERVYRDPKNMEARADFEVIRDPRKVKAPPGAKAFATSAEAVKPHRLAGGKGSAHFVLEEKNTGSPEMSLTMLEVPAGAEIARHSHPGASELLYIVEGSGKLTVGSETMSFGKASALALPADQPHAIKAGGEAITAIQIFAPAGAEQTTVSK